MIELNYPNSAAVQTLLWCLESSQRRLSNEIWTEEEWQEVFPLSSRWVNQFGAAEILNKLSALMLAEGLWQMTPYHEQLLYEVLDYELELLEDKQDVRYLKAVLSHDLSEVTEVIEVDLSDPYSPKYQLSKSAVIDCVFQDLDFLLTPAKLAALGRQEKEKLMFSEHLFGVVNGLKPTAGELELVTIDFDSEC